MNPEMEQFLHKALAKYADIPEKEMSKLIERLHIKSLKKDAFFLRQGDAKTRLALIYSGTFRVHCTDESGSEKTLAFRVSGQFLAAYSPFITKQRTWYSIQALTDAVIIYFDFSDYAQISGGDPCWNELEKNYIVELFIEKENRERSFLLENATTRYIEFQKKYPEIQKTAFQYHIASYLGISPISLSRIRTELKQSENATPGI